MAFLYPHYRYNSAVTSRPYLLPLLMFVLYACFFIKKKVNFLFFLVSTLAILIWLAYAATLTSEVVTITGASSKSVLLYYIENPQKLFSVFLATISDNSKFYRYSFLGILGWLDTQFSVEIYNRLSIIIATIGLCSISIKNIMNEWFPRVLVIIAAFVSISLIFFSLLLCWTPHPATIIQGVQGRYFLIPMIMIAYAISGSLKLHGGFSRKCALLLVAILGIFTIIGTTQLLIERYYLVS